MEEQLKSSDFGEGMANDFCAGLIGRFSTGELVSQ